MNKKLLILLISSSVMLGSAMPAMAATMPEISGNQPSVELRNTDPYFIMDTLKSLGYPTNVIYGCDNIITAPGSTTYIINLTINGRKLVGQHITLEVPVRGRAFARGITAEKVTELNAMSENDWTSLKKMSKENEIYNVRLELYYSQNVYVEESEVTELAQCIGYVNDSYVPCTKYELTHQGSGQKFITIINSVDGTILSGAELISE